MTQAELAAQVGVHEMTVSKWERGEQKVRKGNLRRIQEVLPRADLILTNEDGTVTLVEVKTSRQWPDPQPGDPQDVREYLTFFGADPEGFRRMARHLSLADLAKAALQTALDEDMPGASFEILYARLRHLLPSDEAEQR